jgi:hypothetical protein
VDELRPRAVKWRRNAKLGVVTSLGRWAPVIRCLPLLPPTLIPFRSGRAVRKAVGEGKISGFERKTSLVAESRRLGTAVDESDPERHRPAGRQDDVPAASVSKMDRGRAGGGESRARSRSLDEQDWNPGLPVSKVRNGT